VEKGETHDYRLDMPNDLQQVFNTYQKEFRVAMERAAGTLRNAIAAAQQSISTQLRESGLDLAQQPAVPSAQPPPAQPPAAQVVDQAFVWARQIWESMEIGLAEGRLPPDAPVSVKGLPNPLEPVPGDPLAASGFLMSHATDSLNDAMESIIQAMNTRSDQGTGE